MSESAPDPRPLAVPTKQVENDRFIVTEWRFAAGAHTGWHRHAFDYVVVPMTDCKFLIEEEGGDRRVDTPKGQVYRREAGVAHNVVNGGTEFMSFIEIEYK